jgi:hypothetical protein
MYELYYSGKNRVMRSCINQYATPVGYSCHSIILSIATGGDSGYE